MTNLLIVRRDAAQAVLDAYLGHPFEWGRRDCVRLAARMMRKLGRQPKGFARAGEYASEKGAIRALRAAGFETLEEAVDAQGLPRIAPAEALPGDIVALEGEGGWPALTVSLGNGRVLGFYEGVAAVLQPANPLTAWRVDPCLR